MTDETGARQALALGVTEADAARPYVYALPSAGTETQAEVEDARRRFILALRMLTVKKESSAKAEAMLAQWRADLDREVDALRRKRRANTRRKWVRNLFWLTLLVCYLLHLPYFQGWMWIIFFMAGAAEVATNPKRKDAATALARARDPRATGVLAKAVRDGDSETKEVATKGLLSILPSLRASDRECIDAEGMAALISLLAWGEGLSVATSGADVDLKLAILRALEQVGDARAIPAVRKLLTPPRVAGFLIGGMDRMLKVGVGAKLDAIHRAAAECLPYLEQRAEAERMRERLLRPAAAPTNAADILLRPAGGAPTTPDELLLRPVEGGEG